MNVLTTTITTTTTDEMLSTTASSVDDDLDGTQESINHLKYVVLGVMGSSLAIVGFLGNILSMVVLQQRQMRSSTSYYLLSLAIYDNGVLLGMLFYFILPALAINTNAADVVMTLKLHTMPIGYPLSLTAQMASIYTCVGFTIERFIAVCRPLHVANTCTKSRALRAILLIFVWSVAYNIPRFFHYHIAYTPLEFPSAKIKIPAPSENASSLIIDSEYQQNVQPSGCTDLLSLEAMTYPGYNVTAACAITGTNSVLDSDSSDGEKMSVSFQYRAVKPIHDSHHRVSTVTPLFAYPSAAFSLASTTPSAASSTPNSTPVSIPRIKETEFGSNPVFQHIYLIYSYLFFMFLLPFTIILVLNMYLIKAVNKSRSTRQSLSASGSKDHNLNVMLIAVIVVFLVCQFPALVDNILLAVMGQERLDKSYIYQVFYIMCTFMVEINTAVNFILYCLFGKKFRMVLLAVLGLKKKRRKHVAYRSTVFKSTRSNGIRSYDTEVSTV